MPLIEDFGGDGSRALLMKGRKSYNWLWGSERARVTWELHCKWDGAGGMICEKHCDAWMNIGEAKIICKTPEKQGYCCIMDVGWGVRTPPGSIKIEWNIENLKFVVSITGIGSSAQGSPRISDCCSTTTSTTTQTESRSTMSTTSTTSMASTSPTSDYSTSTTPGEPTTIPDEPTTTASTSTTSDHGTNTPPSTTNPPGPTTTTASTATTSSYGTSTASTSLTPYPTRSVFPSASPTTTAACEGGCEYMQKFMWSVDVTGKMTGGFHHTPSHKATPEDSDCRSDIATGGGTFEITLLGGGGPVAITRDMLNTELGSQFAAAGGDPRDDDGYFTGDGSVAGGLPDGVSVKAFLPPDDVDTLPPIDYGDIKAPTATAFNLNFWHDVHCYCDDASHHNVKKQTIKFSSAAPPADCKLAGGKYTCEFKETDNCKKTTRSRHGRRATRKIIFEPDL